MKTPGSREPPEHLIGKERPMCTCLADYDMHCIQCGFRLPSHLRYNYKPLFEYGYKLQEIQPRLTLTHRTSRRRRSFISHVHIVFCINCTSQGTWFGNQFIDDIGIHCYTTLTFHLLHLNFTYLYFPRNRRFSFSNYTLQERNNSSKLVTFEITLRKWTLHTLSEQV